MSRPLPPIQRGYNPASFRETAPVIPANREVFAAHDDHFMHTHPEQEHHEENYNNHFADHELSVHAQTHSAHGRHSYNISPRSQQALSTTFLFASLPQVEFSLGPLQERGLPPYNDLEDPHLTSYWTRRELLIEERARRREEERRRRIREERSRSRSRQRFEEKQKEFLEKLANSKGFATQQQEEKRKAEERERKEKEEKRRRAAERRQRQEAEAQESAPADNKQGSTQINANHNNYNRKGHAANYAPHPPMHKKKKETPQTRKDSTANKRSAAPTGNRALVPIKGTRTDLKSKAGRVGYERPAEKSVPADATQTGAAAADTVYKTEPSYNVAAIPESKEYEHSESEEYEVEEEEQQPKEVAIEKEQQEEEQEHKEEEKERSLTSDYEYEQETETEDRTIEEDAKDIVKKNAEEVKEKAEAKAEPKAEEKEEEYGEEEFESETEHTELTHDDAKNEESASALEATESQEVSKVEDMYDEIEEKPEEVKEKAETKAEPKAEEKEEEYGEEEFESETEHTELTHDDAKNEESVSALEATESQEVSKVEDMYDEIEEKPEEGKEKAEAKAEPKAEEKEVVDDVVEDEQDKSKIEDGTDSIKENALDDGNEIMLSNDREMFELKKHARTLKRDSDDNYINKATKLDINRISVEDDIRLSAEEEVDNEVVNDENNVVHDAIDQEKEVVEEEEVKEVHTKEQEGVDDLIEEEKVEVEDSGEAKKSHGSMIKTHSRTTSSSSSSSSSSSLQEESSVHESSSVHSDQLKEEKFEHLEEEKEIAEEPAENVQTKVDDDKKDVSEISSEINDEDQSHEVEEVSSVVSASDTDENVTHEEPVDMEIPDASSELSTSQESKSDEESEEDITEESISEKSEKVKSKNEETSKTNVHKKSNADFENELEEIKEDEKSKVYEDYSFFCE